jgi:hypothetical protein
MYPQGAHFALGSILLYLGELSGSRAVGTEPRPLRHCAAPRARRLVRHPLRHGVSLDQMSPSQRDAARELLRVSLSVRGFETARNVMQLNEVLGEITGN